MGLKAKFIGTGMSVPENIMTNKDLEKLVETNDEWITTRTGIRERRIVTEDQWKNIMASDLGVAAAKNAASTRCSRRSKVTSTKSSR